MLSKNILLSICMPTYNRVNHIQRQLSYFEKEITGDIEDKVEVIISNNASSDGTRQVLDQFVNRYPWLRINNNPENLGAYGNMQLLLRLAQGTYIWLPGDDDYLKRGLIGQLIGIIERNEPNYIYLSRRNIAEKTKKIHTEGKKHPVVYDTVVNLRHKQIVELLVNNYGDLKFQTSNVFRRELVLGFEKDFARYSLQTQANCHSLYKAVRSLEQQKSYFVSEISVLNGDEISWGDSMISYLSIHDAEFANSLCDFGFTKKECGRIRRRQLATAVAFYLTHNEMMKKWIAAGKPGWSLSLIPELLYLIIRKILRVMGVSGSYCHADVETGDFLEKAYDEPERAFE